MKRFFVELDRQLKAARENDRGRYREFFARLQPALEAAKKLENELNRRLAHRFNVLKYLRTDELGLSRIIANLLDPEGSHGQGPLFLRTLLTQLNVEPSGTDLNLERARVTVEQQIENRRRIDIYVQISQGGQPFCLAMENKPDAGDQKNQVKDYLEHLGREYGKRFVLIYLSGDGQGPSEWSLPRAELEQWRGRLWIMPYHKRADTDLARGDDTHGDNSPSREFTDHHAPCSLTQWLAACGEKCRVERLRWFLRETETYCERRFGDQAMTTESETRAVRDYLLSNPENLPTAQAVFEAWPTIVNDVCRNFGELLRDRIERAIANKHPELSDGLRFEYSGNMLSIYRPSWKPYRTIESASVANARTTVVLDGAPTNKKYWGVQSPVKKSEMVDSDKRRRVELDKKLKNTLAQGRTEDWYPRWEYVDAQYGKWASLVGDLVRECKTERGDVSDYYVRIMIEVAANAIPVIDQVEGDSV